MKQALLALLASLAAVPAVAQTPPSNAADAAKAFSLDMLPSADAKPSGIAAHFTLDTPIGLLVADRSAKAVLDKDLPGLSDDSNLPKFQSYSLRQFQSMTGGQLTDALLAKTGADLAAIPGGPDAVVPMHAVPATVAPAARDKRLDSGR